MLAALGGAQHRGDAGPGMHGGELEPFAPGDLDDVRPTPFGGRPPSKAAGQSQPGPPPEWQRFWLLTPHKDFCSPPCPVKDLQVSLLSFQIECLKLEAEPQFRQQCDALQQLLQHITQPKPEPPPPQQPQPQQDGRRFGTRIFVEIACGPPTNIWLEPSNQV